MNLPRFNVGAEIELRHNFWLHDPQILGQWNDVLGFQAGQEVLLFDGEKTERLYRIVELKDNEAHLELITEFVPSRQP